MTDRPVPASPLTARQRRTRGLAMAFWRAVNPPTRPLAGWAPWWVLLETTGRRSGQPRRVPLARGPVDGNVAWLIAVHGEHASFARNIAADPRVRLRIAGRWRAGTASLQPLDEQVLERFGAYARSGPRTLGIEPRLLRVELRESASAALGWRRVVELLLPVQNRVLNPFVAALIDRGLGPPTYALVETVGRRTGRIRRVPVANGLQGDTFWLIAGRGERAAYVHNLRANPRVRVKAPPPRLRDGRRAQWRSGTAHPLPGDDARARHRTLGRGRPGYRLDGLLLGTLGRWEDMLTVRIDLD